MTEVIQLHYHDVQSGEHPGLYVRVGDVISWIEGEIRVTKEIAANPEHVINQQTFDAVVVAFEALVETLAINAVESS